MDIAYLVAGQEKIFVNYQTHLVSPKASSYLWYVLVLFCLSSCSNQTLYIDLPTHNCAALSHRHPFLSVFFCFLPFCLLVILFVDDM